MDFFLNLIEKKWQKWQKFSMKNIYFLTIKLNIINLSVFYYIDNDTDKLYNVRMNEQRGIIMKFMPKEEFINESNIEIIQKLMEKKNGYRAC